MSEPVSRSYPERIDFADPYKRCLVCFDWITGVEYPAPHEPGEVLPCRHRKGYEDMCPSWSPVDGCNCERFLGFKPHGEPERVSAIGK